jgi:hypothetical protein
MVEIDETERANPSSEVGPRCGVVSSSDLVTRWDARFLLARQEHAAVIAELTEKFPYTDLIEMVKNLEYDGKAAALALGTTTLPSRDKFLAVIINATQRNREHVPLYLALILHSYLDKQTRTLDRLKQELQIRQARLMDTFTAISVQDCAATLLSMSQPIGAPCNTSPPMSSPPPNASSPTDPSAEITS